MTTLAQRQKNMKMRTQGLPHPKLSRTDALNQLADQIDQLPAGSEKAALLARYLETKGRRRVTRNRPKPQPKDEQPPRSDGELFEIPTTHVTMTDGSERNVDTYEFTEIPGALCKQWQETNAPVLGTLVNFFTPSDFVDHDGASPRFLAEPTPSTMRRHRESFATFGHVHGLLR